ncbi:MAG TPA: HAD-IA family hydrolase [Candidatus Saccharimonadales bacterium]|nr:HAD-IA family hydrolase [Candidatus Saccharimonadales bacterium]
MKKQVIIFDFDGTIADSFDFVTSYLLGQANAAPLSLKEREKLFRGLSIRKMADKLGMPLLKKAWIFFHGRRTMTKHMAEIKPFPGMVDVIKELHAKGYRLFAVSSNRNENIQIFLRNHGIADFFSGTLGSASVVGKTMALRTLLWHREISAVNCTYIGDEVGDIKAAKQLRIKTIAVTWGYNDIDALKAQAPDAIVKSPGELLKIIAGLQ